MLNSLCTLIYELKFIKYLTPLKDKILIDQTYAVKLMYNSYTAMERKTIIGMPFKGQSSRNINLFINLIPHPKLTPSRCYQWQIQNNKASKHLIEWRYVTRHNFVSLYLYGFQSQKPFRFNCQSVKVITFSLFFNVINA